MDLKRWHLQVLKPRTAHLYIVFLAATKSRRLELLAFDEYCRFDTSAFF